MPTIAQLPLATSVAGTDELPVSQGGVARAVQVATLLEPLQQGITLATGMLLGRSSAGPGGPESVALGPGLTIQNDVLQIDNANLPQTGTLDTQSQLLLNGSGNTAQLMPVSLLRGLYTPGSNISIDGNGVISSTPTPATGNSIGAVAVGEALVINASGQLSVDIGTITGTVAAGNDARITGAEQTANKDNPNGYCGLDSNGLVPVALLPPFASSPVTSVNGQTGSVVLTVSDIGGIGSIAGQNANAVDLTGGVVSGVDLSNGAVTTAASGSVARSLAARFSDCIDLNDFGPVRDGHTDDSAAFIAACQAAMSQQKALYVPAGGPVLLTDAAQQNLTNIRIFGDAIRDYDGPSGYGHQGSCLWFTGTVNTPFLLGPNVQFHGLNFFWPNQTETATVGNGGKPQVYPPLFAMQNPAQNITYFNFTDCQVTNCYDFFTATSTSAVVGACLLERCIVYAINTCFTFTNNPEVFFIANSLFTWGVYDSVVSVGPTYNLRTYTNTAGTWMKILGNGSSGAISTTTVGGIMSANNYIYGSSRGVWLAAGTLDVSSFVDTSFDTVPTVLQGDPGCAIFSTRFIGGNWYPIYFSQTTPDTIAIVLNDPAPNGTGLNLSLSAITIPFLNGSLASVTGANIANLSFSDIRCLALGHTNGGVGPYYAFSLNVPSASVRISNCDFIASNAALSNTGVLNYACGTLLITDSTFRQFSAALDLLADSGMIVLEGNTTEATQGPTALAGSGTATVHDLGNVWDITNYTYNGFSAGAVVPGATIGVAAVASTAASGLVGVQPSALASSGGTRFGVSSLGNASVSLLTNGFAEEQIRVERVPGSVNYVALGGATSGAPPQITVGGSDPNAAIQLFGLGSGATLLGSPGPSGSPVIRLGGTADQGYLSVAPGTGFTIAVPANCSTVLLRPGTNLSSGTITLPAAFADGQKIEIWASRSITTLTVNSAVGATIANGAGFPLNANSSVVFFWNAATATWFQSLGAGLSAGSLGFQEASAVNITGGQISGLGSLQVGSDGAASATVTVDASGGSARQLVFATASQARWSVGADATPENQQAASVSVAAGAGATSLTLASVAGISVGMLVAGSAIAPATVVTAVPGNGTILLSQPTTGAITAGEILTCYTNQGSDYQITPFDNTGASLAPSLGQAFTILRATGQTVIQSLQVAGSAAVPTAPAGDSSSNAASTAFVSTAILRGAVPLGSLGTANGVATLDATGHVPLGQLPAAIQGALNYLGTWNAATNVPALASGTGSKGEYYTVATAGTTALDGIEQWNPGDHCAFNGAVWEKLDGISSEVLSVAGRTGAVILGVADIAGLGGMAQQAANAVTITGGTIDATPIGGTIPAAGTFSTLGTNGGFSLGGATITVPSFAGIQIFGGASVGGAARGLGAFDGQQYRALPSQVAGGQYAVQFGINNTAAAAGSIAVGGGNAVGATGGYAGAFGNGNAVSGTNGFAFGVGHTLAGSGASAFGSHARDFGRFGVALLAGGVNASNGDAQRAESVLRAISTGTATRLTADGNSPGNANTVNLQPSQAMKLDIEIIGFNSVGNAAACWVARDVLLGRGTPIASTSLSSSLLTAGGTLGVVSGWSAPTIAADTANGGLAVSAGFAAGTTIKWVARVVSLEVM